jgi:hypothetical protein
MRDLWLSKRTGRKRTGTRVGELRKLFEDGITVQSIFEPIQACLAEEPACDIRVKMEQLDFDVIGIKESGDAPVEGYVMAVELNHEKCREAKRDFHVSDLISDATPLIDVMSLLRTKERVFVLAGNSVDGIVTRADLQKPPVRLLLFGLITLLDMHITFLLRHYYPNESWRSELTEGRVQKALDLMKQREARNEKLDLIDCLQFCDKSLLIFKNNELMERLGIGSKDEGQPILKSLQEIRDKLAHSQDLVTGSSWNEIITTIEVAERMIQSSETAIDSMR